jgi:hypothetical protein
MTLVEFLLARIAEDEAVARAAIGTAAFSRQTGRWSFENVHDSFGAIPIVFAVTDAGAKTQAANMEAAWEREERGTHIARWDPARILAECEAKRRIVELHLTAMTTPPPPDPYQEGLVQGWRDTSVLQLLALPYADHPDYDPAWRP